MAATVGAGDGLSVGLSIDPLNGSNGRALVNEWGPVSDRVYVSFFKYMKTV